MDHYTSYDAVGLAELVYTHAVSPTELLDGALAAIETANPSLNAVVRMHVERARAAIGRGLPQGRFAGVPFLLKDLDLAVAGEVVTLGSRLFDGFVPDHDSTLVRRYEAAGLVILGRTTSAEMGLSFATESLRYGATRNPWDLALSPGGSSGGSAAAVASGMVPMAHATDGGGSIRQPAALTGLFGLKPSRGRTPPGPSASEIFFGLSVNHALTRSVRDSAALLDATQGIEPGALHGLPAPVLSYERCAAADPKRLRIALQTAAFGGGMVDPACVLAAQQAARFCELLGHIVEEASPPLGHVPFSGLFRRLAGALTASFVVNFAKQHGIADPLALVEPVNAAWIEEGRRASATDVVEALASVQAIGRAYATYFQTYDMILSPVIASRSLATGWLSGESRDLDRQIERFQAHAPFTFPYNAAGCPAMSVPFAIDDGTPTGVQFAAAVGREDLLFGLRGSDRAGAALGRSAADTFRASLSKDRFQ